MTSSSFSMFFAKRTLATSLVAGLTICVSGESADAQRRGFVIGLGLGAGPVSQQIRTVTDVADEDAAAWGMATDFLVGAATSDRWTIYYTQKATWFRSFIPTRDALGNPVTLNRLVTSGFTGLGVSYAPEPNGRFSVSAGTGVAWWAQVFEESTECLKLPLILPCFGAMGGGLFAAGGYEIVRNVLLQLQYVWGTPVSDGTFLEATRQGSTLLLTVGLLSN